MCTRGAGPGASVLGRHLTSHKALVRYTGPVLRPPEMQGMVRQEQDVYI